MCVLLQIICTTVVVAVSILLAGGSLVCLSRGSWAQNDQIPDSADNFVTEFEPENEALFDPNTPSHGLNRGTFSFVDYY